MTGLLDERPTRTTRAGAVVAGHDLCKELGGRHVVDAVGLEVRPGEVYGLLGPEGSGKTTVVRLLCGLLRPDAGVALVQGRPVDELTARELGEAVGCVPESVTALPSMTVADNVRFWARLSGVPDGRRRDRATEVLARVGAEEHAAERLDSCSLGVQRRVGLAVALLHRPDALVLDAPTAGVGPRSRELLLATLARLRDEGVAVLLATRDAVEVASLCDRVGVLGGGRLVDAGRPAHVLRRAASPAFG